MRPPIETQFIRHYNLYNIIGYSVNQKYCSSSEYNGLPLWPLEELDLYIDKEKTLVFVAIFWNRLNADRRLLFEKVRDAGFKFANLISPSASIYGNIGINCWIRDSVVIHEDVEIGDNVYIADFALIGHLTRVQDHCFIAVRSSILGGCILGEQCFIGACSTIFDTTSIGKKCVIGACTAIKRNVPDYCVCKIQDNIAIKQYTDEIIETKWLAHHNIR